jgi:hypothetical protein
MTMAAAPGPHQSVKEGVWQPHRAVTDANFNPFSHIGAMKIAATGHREAHSLRHPEKLTGGLLIVAGVMAFDPVEALERPTANAIAVFQLRHLETQGARVGYHRDTAGVMDPLKGGVRWNPPLGNISASALAQETIEGLADVGTRALFYQNLGHMRPTHDPFGHGLHFGHGDVDSGIVQQRDDLRVTSVAGVSGKLQTLRENRVLVV